MKPICATCRVFFRIIEQGAPFEERMPGPHGEKRRDQPLPEGWHCGICGPGVECQGHPMFDRLCGSGRDAPLKVPGPLANWQPYKLWLGDLWRCPCCGAEIIVGVAQRPIAEHYMSGYAAAVEMYQPKIQIDDC